MQRRKRIRNSVRDDYEFEMLEEQDGGAGINGGATGKMGKRRAGELYDAFAGESDEDMEMFSDGEEYRDEDGSVGVVGRQDEERGRSGAREDRENLLGR